MDILTDYKTHATAITELFKSCFTASEGPQEGAIIGDLVQNLIANTPETDLYGFTIWDNTTLMGGIFMSRLVYPNDPRVVFLLSPVAIATPYQGRGLGQELITSALATMAKNGVDFVVTYGDPAFYGRVGFLPVTVDDVPAPYALQFPQGWLCNPLHGTDTPNLQGPAHCVNAFQNPELW